MRVVVIGSMGHIGTYLIPRLVEAGHDVISISRGQRQPYRPHLAWQSTLQIVIDREKEEAAGVFSKRILSIKPDVVMDMICFTLESCQHLVDTLRNQIGHFIHCGTIWVHGPSIQVPTTEDQPRCPFGDYGIQKAAIEAFLLEEFRVNGFPATVLHPGHIVGPGWLPLNPAGHFNPQVFTQLAQGEELALPNFGMETVHHVHADDVAQAFIKAMENPTQAIGQNFHVVSPAALTLRGYAESVARWFGKEARLKFLPWETWQTTVSPEEASATWDHIAHSPNCSITKAERLLGYSPRYSSLEGVREAVNWLVEQRTISI